MKYIITCILMLMLSTLNAQDIEIKKDLVLIDGVESFKIIGGALSNQIIIENMDKKKLIFLKMQDDYKSGVMSFKGLTGLTANYVPTIPLKKMLAKEIIDNELLENGELNQENVERYCAANGVASYNNDNSSIKRNSRDLYVPVNRNKEANIFTNNNKITQDFVEIGTYKKDKKLANGKFNNTIIIYGKDGTEVAEMQYETFAESATIYLLQLKEKKELDIENNNDLGILKDLIKYLIKEGVL